MPFDIAYILRRTPRSSLRISQRRNILPFYKLRLSPLSPRRARSRRSPRGAQRSDRIASSNARRCLEEEFRSTSIPLTSSSRCLIADEVTVCEKSHEISKYESLIGRMSELVRVEFPSLRIQHRIVQDCSSTLCWLEVTSPTVHLDGELGPCDTVRLLLSESGLYTMQALFPFIQTIAKGKLACMPSFP